MASSADGSVQFAAGRPGFVNNTANYWVQSFYAGQLGKRAWTSLAASSGGTTLIAAAEGSNLMLGHYDVANASNVRLDTHECTGSGARNW